MATVHGKSLVVTLGGDSLTAYSNACEFGRTSDSHDTTVYGMRSKRYAGGLLDGTCTISGVYDTAVGGPRATIEPLLGTNVELVHQPEGVGTGKPQRVVEVLVTGYSESSPVADMVTWSCDLQLSGDVDDDPQI